MSKLIVCKSVIGSSLLLLSASVLAHHPLGGSMPSNFFEGILSGFGHPIIGLDHLAFIIAAGLLAWKIGATVKLVLSFIVATAVGSLVISQGLTIPIVETLVLASVALIGIILAAKKLPASNAMQIFYIVAGFFHGCAYGGAVIGAEPTPIVAYLIGFIVIQSVIALGAVKLVDWLNKQSSGSEMAIARLVGAAVFGIAFSYGFEIAEGALLGGV